MDDLSLTRRDPLKASVFGVAGRPGQVFLMGDERDFSFDSRDFGPVAVEDVVGLVRSRVWPSPGPLSVDPC
jgi:hypothetical protein